MNGRLKLWALAGLVLSSRAINGFAAEATVYDFDGWKIAVTPGDFPSTATTRSRPKSEISPTHEILPVEFSDSALKRMNSHPSGTALGEITDRSMSHVSIPHLALDNLQQVVLRPVSLKQDVSIAQPAPTPLETTSESIPTGAMSPLQSTSSHATRDQQTVVPTECCGLPSILPRVADAFSNPTSALPQTLLYNDVYNSIPFSRAEYNANPSYRHDATMEFLFGQLRPTVIQRVTTINYNYQDDAYFYPHQPYYPYSYGLRIHRSR